MAKSVTLSSGRPGVPARNLGSEQQFAPVRTCVGCRERAPRSQLVRLASLGEPYRLSLDLAVRLGGRGAWIHPSLACFDLAQKKRAFNRALHCSQLQAISEARQALIDWLERES